MNPSESITPKIFAPCYMFYYDKFCPVPDANVYERKTRSCQQKHHFFLFFHEMTKKMSLCPQSSAVIRMMQNFLGVETFRKGIQVLINRIKIR